MITTQILLTNPVQINQIETCLESLLTLPGDILVCDIANNSNDVLDACRALSATVYKSGETNRSAIRNKMINQSKTPWQLMINPNEVLADVGDIKSLLYSNTSYYNVNVLSGSIITKEIRFWNKDAKLKFVNPVFETLDVKTNKISNALIYEIAPIPVPLSLVQDWRQSTINNEVIYYESLSYLSQGQTDKFICLAEEYLFLEKKNKVSTLMLKYYLSLSYCHHKKDVNLSLKHCLECLAVQPTMAEFWCLLGDIYYFRMKDYRKSKQFYANAKCMGNFRVKEDALPIFLDRYNDYPDKMIESCDKLINSKDYVIIYHNN